MEERSKLYEGYFICDQYRQHVGTDSRTYDISIVYRTSGYYAPEHNRPSIAKKVLRSVKIFASSISKDSKQNPGS